MRYLFTLCCMCLFFQSCGQKNREPNLDFELKGKHEQPIGWWIVNNYSQKEKVEEYAKTHHLDSEVKQNGKYSYSIDLSSGYKEWSGCASSFNKTYDAKYITLTGYLKTEDVVGRAGLWLRVDGSKGQSIAFDNMSGNPVSGDSEWTKYSIRLPYDKTQARKIIFGAILTGTGKMWVDNLQIIVDGKKDIIHAKEIIPEVLQADLDTAHFSGSGVATIKLTEDNKKRLVNLGMLWGFIKYHHPDVQAGKHNMDAELFRILPRVLSAKDDFAANKEMEEWLDKFGQPKPCKKCVRVKEKDEIKLMPDYGYLFAEGNFHESLRNKLSYIKSNLQKVDKQYYVDLHQYVDNASFTHEEPYDDMLYPDAGFRLLALYRYWNIVQYFFPNRHLTDTKWNEVLGASLSDFCNAKDSADYVMACTRLIVKIDDTHGGIGGAARPVLEKIQGELSPPFICKYIENRVVIKELFDDVYPDACRDLKVGDVIVKIDGISVNDLIDKYLPVTYGSNIPVKMRVMLNPFGSWLLNGKAEEMPITILRDGDLKNVTVKRYRLKDSLSMRFYHGYDIKEPCKILDDNIGYIFVNTFTDENADSVFEALSQTKGIILDMRGYPKSRMAYGHVNKFKEKKSEFVKITTPSLSMPGLFEYTSTLFTGGQIKDVYQGKLVVIVNEITQSAAEFATMSLQTVPGSVVIGSTTSGADGNIVRIELPGGIATVFSGIGCIYPDGTESQRLGVKIDKVVTPTIQGIKAGRDEMLEAAIDIMNGK